MTAPPVNHDSYPDSLIRRVLEQVKTVAMVGASGNHIRPSFFVLKYLLARGYRVVPVNPGAAGTEILGQQVYASLADIPFAVDMIDIFRASEQARPIVEAALALTPRPKVIWMQLGIRNDDAARLAEAEGLTVIMNRCPKIEIGRLSSEISWFGVNSRTLSAKRAPIPTAGMQRLSLQRESIAAPSAKIPDPT